MKGCPHHGWSYWAGAGRGRGVYGFCCICKDLAAMDAVNPSKVAEAKQFLKDNEDALKPEKSVSVHTTTIAAEFKSGKDNALSRRKVVYGAAEDEFLSRFDTMLNRYDTDRLPDAIAGILEGPVRAAASRYGLTNDIVLDVRLLIAERGIEVGVEKLLEYVARRERKTQRDAQKVAA